MAAELLGDAGHRRSPLPWRWLATQVGPGVPGAIIPGNKPAPIWRIGQHDPDGFAHCSSKMGHRRIDRDYQIQTLNNRCGVHKVSDFVSKAYQGRIVIVATDLLLSLVELQGNYGDAV